MMARTASAGLATSRFQRWPKVFAKCPYNNTVVKASPYSTFVDS